MDDYKKDFQAYTQMHIDKSDGKDVSKHAIGVMSKIEKRIKYIGCLEDYGYTDQECEEVKFIPLNERILIIHKNHRPLIIKDGKIRGFLNIAQ